MDDAIVVGDGYGGPATAMLLARRGYSVSLLVQPSASPVTSPAPLLWPSGVALLDRWGLLGELRSAGIVPIRRFRWTLWGTILTGQPPPADGIAEALCPQAPVLQRVLLEAARGAGVEIQPRAALLDLLREGGRVVGTETRDGGGLTTDRARIVVGADGSRSRVAAHVGARTYLGDPPRSFTVHTIWDGVELPAAEMHIGQGWSAFAHPIGEDRAAIGVAGPAEQVPGHQRAPAGCFQRTLGQVPELAARLEAGKRVMPPVYTAPEPSYARQPYGPGWALIGSAGYQVDPITSRRPTDALLQADRLVDAIDRTLSGDTPASEALASYQAVRDDLLLPVYKLTSRLARLEPPGAMHRLFLSRVAQDQDLTDRFLGILAGTEPVERFYARRTMVRALLPRIA